jgi:predicted amidohydrolase YtcJ
MRRTANAVAAALVVASCATGVPPAPADLVFVNANVITVDAGFTSAQAVAVRDGRFVAVGSNDAVRAYAGPSTRVVDARGRTMTPGLADGHLHNAGGGPGVDLSRTRSLDELLARVAERARTSNPGDLVVSNPDWHEAQLKEQTLPLRRDLDRVAPDNPVVLVRGGHEFILNSAALSKWSIDRDTPSPAGGEISRYPDGELNGELVDNARSLVKFPPAAQMRVDALAAQLRRLNEAGLTSIRVPGNPNSLAEWQLWQQLKARGGLTMRVSYNFRIYDFTDVERVKKTVESWGVHQGDGDEWLRVDGVKTLIDGGFEGGWMREPYAEPYGRNGTYRGINVVPAAKYIPAVIELNRMGWRVTTHAVGDAAIDMVLDAYEAADRDRSIVGKHWVIEHAFIARPDHFPRMKKLGLDLSVQDHLYLAGPSLVKYWGRERAERVTPVREMLDQGFLVAGGTDSPVVPYPPLWAFYHFVTRGTISDGVLGADQRISRREALQLLTINNARLTGEEKIKGSIEPGKLADFVLLSDDPLRAPDSGLEKIEVLATVVGGRVVYRKDGGPL